MTKYFSINESGFSIRCKLYAQDARNVRRVIVFGHGFGGHKDNHAAEHFAERVLSKYKGVGILTFDWPCHGDDARKHLRLDECDAYLTEVLRYARETLGAQELLCYATSFGGYLVLKYLHDHGNPFRRIALRCPAVNMYEVLSHTIMQDGDADKLAKGRDVLVGFDRKVAVDRVFLAELEANDLMTWDYLDWAEDILILHGTADEIVPMAAAARFADDNVIEFIPVEGAEHRFRDPLKMDIAIREILRHLAL